MDQSLSLEQHRPARSARGGADLAATVLVGLATVLLVAQLLVGTGVYFALAVYCTFLVTIGTLRWVGFGSIAGILLAYLVFSYLGLSQVLKTIYGQPADSNLGAPETTITILTVGITGMCLAAVLVASLLGNRKIISLDFTPAVLKRVRNLSILLGSGLFVASLGVSDATTDVGGFDAIARQLMGGVIFLSLVAETWRVLMVSGGRRSLSAPLLLLMLILTTNGFISNSKQGVADPLVCYLIASIAYRGCVTRRQLAAAAIALVLGITVAYPIIHLTRALRDTSGRISLQVAEEYVGLLFTNPTALYQQWDEIRDLPSFSAYQEGLNYLGSFDDLLGRFVLIANTDVIVAAVDQDGPYGPSLITDGAETLLPTFLDPGKPRDDSGDLLTWHYGLRDWGVYGYPTVGPFAPSYAALEWPGVIFIPFVLCVILLFELQLTGVRLGGNLVGAYFVFENLHFFAGNDLTGYMGAVTRGAPLELAISLMIFYVSDRLWARKLQRRAEHAAVAGAWSAEAE